MTKFILSGIFAFSLLLVGACNGSTNNTAQASEKAYLKSEIIGETNYGSNIERFADCKANVLIYNTGSNITSIEMSAHYREKFCGE